MTKNYKAFLDIETGGFSTSKNGVCEIAMVVTDEDCIPVKEFRHYIKPYLRPDSDEYVSYKDDAMSINGINVDDLWNNGVPVEEVVKMFVNELKLIESAGHDITIIGHNSIAFDVPRIKHLIDRFWPIINLDRIQQEDTKIIAQKRLNLDSCSLANICEFFGIVNEKAHSALSDVYATIEVYKKLKGID